MYALFTYISLNLLVNDGKCRYTSLGALTRTMDLQQSLFGSGDPLGIQNVWAPKVPIYPLAIQSMYIFTIIIYIHLAYRKFMVNV